MLETIAKFISTALFFLCTAIVTGLTPAEPAQTVPTEQAIVENEEFSLVGEWQSGDRTLTFTDSGKLIVDKSEFSYTRNSDEITLSAGNVKYTVTLVPEGADVMQLNGVTLHRVK